MEMKYVRARVLSLSRAQQQRLDTIEIQGAATFTAIGESDV
jgi:hypothetical protein